MRSYYRQIKILAAIGLILIAVIFLGVALAPLEKQAVFSATERGAAVQQSFQGKINLNEASVEELELLPGVGPTMAARIVAYREAHGPFKSAEEIMAVKGIGEKTYQSVKDYIDVSGE